MQLKQPTLLMIDGWWGGFGKSQPDGVIDS
jgi:hypothetical protein